jgi:hypothetical protein
MPRPRKTDYPTWWTWRQADKAWLRQHGGAIWTTALLVLVIGGLASSEAGSAWPLLVLAVVAVAGTVWARSRP